MKKFLSLAIISLFLIIPFKSFAKSLVADSDLDSIVAQSGSITITFDNITIKSKTLKTTSTDFQDFWGPGVPDYVPKYTGNSYFGYADVYLTGGLVERSGSMTMEVVSTSDPNILSGCMLNVTINDLRIRSAAFAVEAKIKLGTTPDLAGDQILGRVYTAGIGATTNGSVTVYAHNNTL